MEDERANEAREIVAKHNNTTATGKDTQAGVRPEMVDKQWRRLCTIGGVAAALQFAFTLVIIVIHSSSGPGPMFPSTAEEYFTALQTNALMELLRADLSSLIIISLFSATFFGLYAGLRRVNAPMAMFATALTFIAIAISIATNSAVSLLHLSDQYAAATTDALRSQLLATGEAVIASNMWNSTAGFFAGILLQGACLLISVVMLQSRNFSKVTAYAGILANGFDLVQHVIHGFMPSISEILLIIAGPFYLIWFPMLAWDLLKLGRVGKERQASRG